MRQPDKPVRPLPKIVQNLLQSLFISLFILITFFSIYRLHSKLAIASLAASAFIAFGFPQAESARPRYLIGGYACGIVSGILCCLIRMNLPGSYADHLPVTILFCALAVFLTAFSMLFFKLQHPPSTALTISMVIEPQPLLMGLSVLGCILVLCLVKTLLFRWLGKYFGDPPP